jgi:hypothetical protein
MPAWKINSFYINWLSSAKSELRPEEDLRYQLINDVRCIVKDGHKNLNQTGYSLTVRNQRVTMKISHWIIDIYFIYLL